MTYSVQNTDGSRTINVAASQVNSSFSVALVGRNVSGYGQYFVQNAIRHLENFASTSAPSDDILLTGQMWYDKSEDVTRVYDGTSWRRMSITVRAAAPGDGVDEGTAYFDTNDNKLKVHNGSEFLSASYAGKISNEFSSDTTIGSPSKYGTALRTMYIPNTSGVYKAVLALVYVSDGSDSGFTDGESIMAIFSDHAEFDISTSLAAKVEGLGDVQLYNQFNDADGIGTTIKPGMNLRNKYSGTAVSLANTSIYANVANAIYTGTSNVQGSAVFTANSTTIIPDTTDSVPLGNTSNRFSTLFIDDVTLGNPASATPRYIKKSSSNVTLDIGESSAPIDNIHVSNIILADGGGISGLNVDTFGSSSSLVDEVWTNEILLDSTGNLKIDSTGVYGLTIYDEGGNILVSPSSGQAVTIAGDETITGIKQFNASITAGSTSSHIGNATGRFGNVYSTYTNTQSGNVTNNFGVSGTMWIQGATTMLSSLGVTGGVTATGAVSSATGAFSGNVSAGNVAATGNVTATFFNGTATSAQYADLAEIYASDEDYEPGTVVKIGGPAEVTQTSTHADVDVFGVVSTSPAFLMNKDATGLPIALQGRVPVKVAGKVKKGERLTTSDIPGVAWGVADEDVPLQAIIGRSLEDKDSGDVGTIEAVIGVK